jgi:hypothetical protein
LIFNTLPHLLMSLQRVVITDQLTWLPSHAGMAASASAGLSTFYESYLKLLPPLGIDRNVPIADYSFARGSAAELNARAAFWDKYGIVLGQPAASQLQRISYQEVAAMLGLPYNAEFDNVAISRAYGGHWPPHLGSSPLLTEGFAHLIAQLIGPAAAVYFYGSQEEGSYEWDGDGFPTDWLEVGTLADLPAVYQRAGAFPTYVFAADHSWCLYQAEAVEWLALGCTTALATTLLANSSLEAFLLVS